MRANKKVKAETLQPQSDIDVAEKALELVIKNAPLDSETIKALRLTCKRTKTAADARVQKFTLSVDQEPEAVQRSGLLNSIRTLEIIFNLTHPVGESHPERSRALGLLNLAVESCKSIKTMKVGISASIEIIWECACTLGNSKWECLEDLTMLEHYSMPDFLAGMLAKPGSLPALKELYCVGHGISDIKYLYNSVFVGNLSNLWLEWDVLAYRRNITPAMIAAMRTLMQQATNLESLYLISGTFEFLDCEKLDCLKHLHLERPVHSRQHPTLEGLQVDFAPALARPWTTLESLSIEEAHLKGPDLARIFEAEDTFPALKKLHLASCIFEVSELSCVRRPHLEHFSFFFCANGHALLSKLAQLMKADTSILPNLHKFHIDCLEEDPIASAREALTEFLSCPQTATLEELNLFCILMGNNYAGLITTIADHCPNLNHMDLRCNKLGRLAVAFIQGAGVVGAWPQLKELIILEREDETDGAHANTFDIEHPYMPPLDVKATLRRVWPGLKCSWSS